MNGSLIVAVATPHGRGAVSIVRLSGENAVETACAMFGIDPAAAPLRQVIYGSVVAEQIRDNAVLLLFRAPKSYTGEDAAEIQCHGSPIVTGAIVREAVRRGARIAEAGEYTRRAFLNGKLDLTAAEGVIDLIESRSVAAARAAFRLVDGAMYREITAISDEIADRAAEIGAVLDYPDEAEETSVNLNPVIEKLDKLLRSYPAGAAAVGGVRVTVAGDVNAGKSTLFNALLGVERSIVTDIPGTTRDAVTDGFEYKGVRFELTDTAGLRETDDPVEKLGIERSHAAVKGSDIVVEVSEDGTFAIENAVHVVSKCDLAPKRGGDVVVSAKTGAGVDALKEILYARVPEMGDETLLTNARQFEAVTRAREHVAFALDALEKGMTDCVASELHCALSALGEITGVKASDNVIDRIFSRFCVGK